MKSCYGNIDRALPDKQCLIHGKGVSGWKINHHPQSCIIAFELTSLAGEGWAAPAQIFQFKSQIRPKDRAWQSE